MGREEGEIESSSKDPKICFLSNYPPKECGIATYTKDLVTSMNRRFNPKLRSRVIAINEPDSHYNYDKKVILEINKDSPQNYKEMAEQVNNNPDLKLVCIEHEFGIFGGDFGENLLPFLEIVEKPVVVTFHSVLPNPDSERKKIVKEISNKTAAFIVMAEAAVEILNQDYGIERSKIYVVHHGTPNARFAPPDQYKKKLNLEGRKVILTFGLLSVGKGVEHMIRSLPPLVKDHPDLLYIILGETHPNVRREEGEKYRNELTKIIKELGLENNVKFHNKYVTLKELVEYILACDIYAFTNLERAQITSGTLAYAVACGRPVVATPVVYAEELLAQDRGIVLKHFKRPEEFTKALKTLLDDEELRSNMAEAAYAFGRQMTWPNVAAKHLSVFNRVVMLREETTKKYPSIKLGHLKKLTDKFGCIQFAKGSFPDKSSGYTVDDNSRALIIATLHNNLTKSRLSHNLMKIYLNFLEFAQVESGNFKNNFKNENEFTQFHSDDAFGRALWSLGYTIDKAQNKKLVEKAKKIFEKSYPFIDNIESARSIAYVINALYHVHKETPRIDYVEKIHALANKLLENYKLNSSPEWHWFEDHLSYDNAKIPESLYIAYEMTGDESFAEAGETALHFLSDTVFDGDVLMPIGQNGWFSKDGRRALFDQQPIDAAAMVHAYLTAYRVTGDQHYFEKANLAFNWFLGKNHLKQMLYDEGTGGCFDGLGKHALNLNQGAESTIAYLLSRLFLEEIKKQ